MIIASTAPSKSNGHVSEGDFAIWNDKGNLQLNAGQLPEAILSYRKALEFKEDAGTYHNLAIAFAKLGQIDQALDSFRHSLELRPDAADTLRNMGVAYSQKGDPEQADRCYRRALELEPNNAQAYLDLGNLLLSVNKCDDAMFHFQQAVRIRPDFAAAHHSLGRAIGRQGKHGDAIPHFEQALRFQPDLADAHHDLGVAFQEVGRHEDAAASFRRALKFNPHSWQTRSNLGVALAEVGQDEESIARYHEALRMAPEAVEVHNNFGNSLRMMGRLDEARATFRRAMELKPNDAGIFNNLGIVHVYAGQIHEALSCYDRALDLAPDFASAHLNRSFAYLTLADFERGWEEYEWRWKEKNIAARDYPQPQWDGSPLDGKAIFLHSEQGLGDVLQFVRYAPLVKERGGFVIVEAPAPLLHLLTDAPGIDQLVARGNKPPDFAVHLPLLSLARIFRTDLNSIPANVPYLFADRRRLERWQGPVRSIQGFRVGLAWQGSKGFKADRHRSIALRHFEPLAKVPGVQLISLQKGYGAEQIAQVADRFQVREFGAEVDQDGAFLDTVAILKHLDLVITSDSAIAHVAGALGVPVWLAISFAADWRWLLDRSDSPWYPTMRLFRQTTFGEWPNVFERIAGALTERVQPAGAAVAAPVPSPAEQEGAELYQKGTELLREGRAAEAEPLFRQALARRPDRWDAHQNLAIALARQGKFDEAIVLFSAYVDRHPQSGDGYNNLGLACLDSGRIADADRYFHQAIRFNPGHADGHNNLGVALIRQERWDDAAAAFEAALRLRPDYADAHGNFGFVLRKLKKPAEALAHYLRVVEIRPEVAQTHIDAGLTLTELQRLEEAEGHFRRAAELQPDTPDAYNNLGILLADLQRLDEAETAMKRAVDLRPEHPETHRNYALILLAAGKVEQGWQEYEWRWKCAGDMGDADLPPRWDGSPLGDRTLYVYAEQGLGDTLHFVRYLPLVKQQKGGRVVLACQPPLIPLLQSCGLDIDRIVPGGTKIPEAQVMAGLLSLPHLLGTTLETIPAEIPYLSADPTLVQRWEQHLQQIQGFRVGIAWQGSPGYGGDCYRSIPLNQFATLARIPGVQLLSLQKGHGSEQLASSAAAVWPIDLGRQVDETGGAFLDSAAVLRNLDLVITSDSSLAHLAGALGVPAWVALSTCSDWRWLRGREDSPWYPTLRLFRQKKRGDWDEVFARIAEQLRPHVAEWSARRPLRVEVGIGEMVDKITILEIKRERLADPAKRANVEVELDALLPVYQRIEDRAPALAGLKAELKTINEALWEIEDGIRDREREADFGEEFIRLARSVYKTNDQRAAVKRAINELAGSRIVEEKGYQQYV